MNWMINYIRFLKGIVSQRHLLISMARREISSQYIGSMLGIVWTIINPLVLITVFWFVFSIGFKAKPLNDIPFVVWLTAGLAPWFIFSEIVLSSVGVIVGNVNLVKKTLFHSQLLPVVRIIAALFNHGILLLILICLLLFHGMPVSLYFLQVFYYLFCLCVLVLGFSWVVSALNVFIRDTAQIVGVIIQVGFWATPIFWDISMMPPRVQSILKLNPVYYIVQGYRESFIYFTPFWHHLGYTFYFWSVAIAMLLVGIVTFQKLKPQFADVL